MMQALTEFLKSTRYYPAVLLAAGLALIAFAPLPGIRPTPKTITLHIEAESFAYSPGVVRVNEGDTVVMALTSQDVVHGLYLDGYDLAVVSDPGQTELLTFIADKPGSFHFRCSVTCGALHPFMIGQIKVGRNELFWRGVAAAVVLGSFGLWNVRRHWK